MYFARKCRRAFKKLKLRQFAKNDDGVTIIEFALLATPFFAIIGAILETGIYLLASQILDTSLQDTSRFIRTGQAKDAAFDIDKFRARVCDGGYGLFDCSKLQLRVRVIDQFSSASFDDPIDIDDEWTFPSSYQVSTRNDIVVAEAYYKWPTFLNILGFSLGSVDAGTATLLSSSRVFMNEPF